MLHLERLFLDIFWLWSKEIKESKEPDPSAIKLKKYITYKIWLFQGSVSQSADRLVTVCNAAFILDVVLFAMPWVF